MVCLAADESAHARTDLESEMEEGRGQILSRMGRRKIGLAKKARKDRADGESS